MSEPLTTGPYSAAEGQFLEPGEAGRIFEAAWDLARGGGPRPRIEDFLLRISEANREAALRDLVGRDIARRWSAGENPTPEDYLDRFPDVDSAWLTAEIGHSGSTPSHGDPLATTPSARSGDLPSAIGRYRVERILGRGGFGVVYLAHDDQLQRPVAIKLPHRSMLSRDEDAGVYLADCVILDRRSSRRFRFTKG
jgi:hypothetical protein